MNGTTREQGIGGLLGPVAIAGVLLTALSPFVVGAPRGAIGVAIGAAMGVGNLWAIAVVIRGFLRGQGLSWGALAAAKFAVLIGVVAVVLKNHWADALPLALGYAALPLGIVFGQVTKGAPAGREG